MMERKHRELLPGIQLTAVQTNKFKTCLLAMTFLQPLSTETAAMNALLPAVLRRGTRQHPDMETMSAALDELYGGVIEPTVRKKGETQCIGFVGSFLDDVYLPEEFNVLESAAKIMGEILLEPVGEPGTFEESYLESERANQINRIRSRINDKQQYATYRLISQMCSGEAYGVDKLGEEAEVAAITGEGLWQRYEALLQTAPIELYYCGSAPVERVEAAMKTALSGLPQGMRKCVIGREENPPCQAPRFFGDSMDVSQGKLSMGFRLDSPCTEPKAAASLLMFNAIFGGSTNSKLFMNVRERLSLCYYANSMADKQKGIVFVSSGVDFNQYEQARDEILAQLDDCRKGKIEVVELESARRYVVNNLRTTVDAQGRLEDYWLGQATSNREDAPDVLEQAVEEVTLEEVKKVAQRLWLDSVYFLQGKEGADL
ncbi:MAG: Zinc protease [Evtepia sp.]|nr:Zinc protease [Evtepia sp.]